jgi:hypothetical protein
MTNTWVRVARRRKTVVCLSFAWLACLPGGAGSPP